MKRLNDWTKELLFGVINFVCIVLLFIYLFDWLDEENETNTYTYCTTISDIEYTKRKGTFIIFDTDEGKAYYRLTYSRRYEKEKFNEDWEILNNISKNNVIVKLIISDDQEPNCPDRSYKHVAAVSTKDRVIFSLDDYNKDQRLGKITLVPLLAIYTVISILVFFFPYNPLMLKIKRSIRKVKKKRK